MRRAILIRADASAAIGTGHIMRGLALAQAWQRTGGCVVFACAAITPTLEIRIAAEGFSLQRIIANAGSVDDASETMAQAKIIGAEWIVADGYGFGCEWQRVVSDAGFRLLVCDDHCHSSHYHAEIVWNQNPAATPSNYANRNARTRLLLGSRYALLRNEFGAWHEWRRGLQSDARKVLVTLGGSDPDNVTQMVITALKSLPNVEAIVVVGGSNPNLEKLQTAVDDASHVRLVVNASNMPELMAWADVAISAGGSTCWELAFMGLPALVAVVADNQAAIAAELDRRGICRSLGEHRYLEVENVARALRELLDDRTTREEMSRRGRQLIDGRGATRLAAALGAPLALTLVSDADTWLNAFLPQLKAELEASGHAVRWVHDPANIQPGDIAFFLSLSRIVASDVLRRNVHNLVVHESALPHGRGWSPLTWQVLEGKNEIPISLIEAGDGVDSGDIYAQDVIRLRGDELVGELRAAQANATLALCRDFIARYPGVCDTARPQEGEPSYYPRRRPNDSRLDPDKSLREQFNLLRVADPDRYPAYFEIAGRRFLVRIAESS